MHLNPDSPFFRFMNTLARFVVLNVIMVLTCLPLITIGMALAALYETLFHYIDNEDSSLVKTYLAAFKANFKKGLLSLLLFVTIAAILIFNLRFWLALNSLFANLVLGIFGLALILLYLTVQYFYPLIAKFDASFKQSLVNALLLPLKQWVTSLVLILIDIATLTLTYFSTGFRALMILFGITFVVYCKAYVFQKRVSS